MSMIELNNPLFHFLINSKFRWCRHLVFIFSIGIILTNHIFLTYEGQTDFINIYAITISYIVVSLLIMYINLYLFIPHLLLRGRYLEYTLVLVAVLSLIISGNIYAEYKIHEYYQIHFGRYSIFSETQSKIISIVYSFVIFALYLISVAAIVFYKHWLLNSKKLDQLKAKQIQTDLDNFKNRISTTFLLDKLSKAAEQCSIKPTNVSRILLQLSQVLRYQLYDCNRENVLLSSEIKFIENYLTLEQICNDRLTFSVSRPKSLLNRFVPPLLFISFIEDALSVLAQQDGESSISIEFSISDDTLTFVCSDNRKGSITKENLTISNRLELLQNKKYNMSSQFENATNQYKLVFQYQL